MSVPCPGRSGRIPSASRLPSSATASPSLRVLSPPSLPESTQLLPGGPGLAVPSPPPSRLLTTPSWHGCISRPHSAHASNSPHHMGHIWLSGSISSPALSPPPSLPWARAGTAPEDPSFLSCPLTVSDRLTPSPFFPPPQPLPTCRLGHLDSVPQSLRIPSLSGSRLCRAPLFLIPTEEPIGGGVFLQGGSPQSCSRVWEAQAAQGVSSPSPAPHPCLLPAWGWGWLEVTTRVRAGRGWGGRAEGSGLAHPLQVFFCEAREEPERASSYWPPSFLPA